MSGRVLARISDRRRRRDRREGRRLALLASLQVFEREERAVLGTLERRAALRRQQDVSARLARLEERVAG